MFCSSSSRAEVRLVKTCAKNVVKISANFFSGVCPGKISKQIKGRKKNKKTKLLVAENGPFGAPLLKPKPPRKSSCGSFFAFFPGNEAHTFFSGGPKWGVLGGGQQVYVEEVYVFFPSLTIWSGPGKPNQKKVSS